MNRPAWPVFPTRRWTPNGFLRSNAMGMVQKEGKGRGIEGGRKKKAARVEEVEVIEAAEEEGGGVIMRPARSLRMETQTCLIVLLVPAAAVAAAAAAAAGQPPTTPRPSPTWMNERPAPCVKNPPKVAFLSCPSARGYRATSQEGAKPRPLLLFWLLMTKNSGSPFFPWLKKLHTTTKLLAPALPILMGSKMAIDFATKILWGIKKRLAASGYCQDITHKI